ncbi:hypothetical protein JTB14_016843 [Gonioctena quinquepunctata]|nr:hypothetical protein JTB14_016843 [Gonioctena quinquepunctata]
MKDFLINPKTPERKGLQNTERAPFVVPSSTHRKMMEEKGRRKKINETKKIEREETAFKNDRGRNCPKNGKRREQEQKAFKNDRERKCPTTMINSTNQDVTQDTKRETNRPSKSHVRHVSQPETTIEKTILPEKTEMWIKEFVSCAHETYVQRIVKYFISRLCISNISCVAVFLYQDCFIGT